MYGEFGEGFIEKMSWTLKFKENFDRFFSKRGKASYREVFMSQDTEV